MTAIHEQWAKEMVQRILYVTIATVSEDGKPWNSPVYAAYDNDGNFYWTSSPAAQHSRNVEHNGNAFLVIYDSTVPEGTGVGGVFIEARVTVLDHVDEIALARHHILARIGKADDSESPDSYLPGGVLRVYKATPARAWVNVDEFDENAKWLRDARAEVPVSALTGLATW